MLGSFVFALAAFIAHNSGAVDSDLKSGHHVVVSVSGFGYDAVRQLPAEGLDEFSHNSGIQIEFLPAWGDSRAQLGVTERILENHMSSPDIYLLDTIWIGRLARYLLDLGPYLDRNAHPGFQELITDDTMNNRLVALPFYLNVGMLYYRSDLLKKYGYGQPPGSWDEMEAMARRIQRGEREHGNEGFWGYVFQGAPYEGLTCNALEWQMSYGAGHVIEPDGTVTVNSINTVKAFRRAAAWIGSISPRSVLSYTEMDSLNTFLSGKAAFLRYWSSGYKAIANRPAMRGKFDVTILPSGPSQHAHVMGGFHLAVSAYSNHAREAAQLIVFLASAHVQKRRALLEGYLPVIPTLYDDIQVRTAVPETSVFRKFGLDHWVSRPSTIAGPLYSDVSRIYYEGVHSILSQERQSDEVLREMERNLIALSPRFHVHK